MRTRMILLGTLAVLSGVLLSLGEEPPASHGTAPSLECFSCHGAHPPRSAAEINLAEFEVPPPHDVPPGLEPPVSGPGLDCAQCHQYAEEVNAIPPNSCVGCHERGGFSIASALGRLVEEVGHPNVIPFVKEVPGDCALCHRENLGPNVHRRHLFARPTFVLHFQTGCTRCHVVEESGEVTLESYPLK